MDVWGSCSESLAPTEETVQQVCRNPALLAGFDDPEIMAAVADIARDPAAFKKYSSIPKVGYNFTPVQLFIACVHTGIPVL